MSADDMWGELTSDGWKALERWVAEKKEESLHLDFKLCAPKGGKLVKDDDRANLAKMLSGYANISGGVGVFGAATERNTRQGPDFLARLAAVDDVALVAEHLRSILGDSVYPRPAGIDVHAVVDPTSPSRGIVAVKVPVSEARPFRALGPPETRDRYFQRTATRFEPMPHELIQGLFTRTPRAILRVTFDRRRRALVVHNDGPGFAERAYAYMRAETADGGSARAPFMQAFPWSIRRPPTRDGFNLAAALETSDILYPGEAYDVFHFMAANEVARVRGRVLALHALPADFDLDARAIGEPA